VFHGAFIHGLIAGWDMLRMMDFANTMAGLNCTKFGARGGIGTQSEAESLMASGSRHINKNYCRRAGVLRR